MDQRLLRFVHDALRLCPLTEVADVDMDSAGHLMMFGRRLAVTVAVRDERPGQVHAHVTSWLPDPAAPEGRHGLEACVLGYGETADAAMQQAAALWLKLVGAPVLSAIAARPLLDADHFEGHEEWGIPGGHGFVGPFVVRRATGAEIDLDALALSPAFQFDGYPADGRPHLAKVVLIAQDGRWQRTIEIDGHTYQHSEDDWPGMPAPASALMCVRFAVFVMVELDSQTNAAQ